MAMHHYNTEQLGISTTLLTFELGNKIVTNLLRPDRRLVRIVRFIREIVQQLFMNHIFDSCWPKSDIMAWLCNLAC